jgi:hypothetical protein
MNLDTLKPGDIITGQIRMPKPVVPYINAATLKAQADKVIPMLEAVDLFVPGSTQLNQVLNVLQAIVDNDTILTPVVNLINQISGAQALTT